MLNFPVINLPSIQILRTILFSAVVLTTALKGQISYIDSRYTQSFNGEDKTSDRTLTGTSNIGQPVELVAVEGWHIAKLGGSASDDMQIMADDGTLSGGRAYFYGTDGTSERALGLKGSGSHYAAAGAMFVNDTNATISAVTITYSHEIWSVQGTTGNNAFEDRLFFAYGFSGDGITTGNFLTSTSMIAAPQLDAISSSSRTVTGITDLSTPDRSRDGNSTASRQRVSGVLSEIEWDPGEILYVRWQDEDTRGFDAGHGIDDFTIETGGEVPNLRSSLPDVGVRVDGIFSDWKEDYLYQDAPDDVRTVGGLELISVGGALAEDGLSLYVRTAEPFVLSTSDLSIYLNTDGSEDTGGAFIGEEIIIRFSSEQSDSRFYPADVWFLPENFILPAEEVITDLLPNGLNAVASHPASDEYELLIPLTSLRGLQQGGKLGIFIRHSADDFVPDLEEEQFYIKVPPNIRPNPEFSSFVKEDPSDIRVASWNVLVNGPYDSNKEAAFGRLLQAAKPDIINFQELYQPSAIWARDFVSSWLPLEEGEWYASKNSDCITVSRFPIENAWSVDGNLVVRIDTEGVWGFDSVFVNAHTPAHVQNQQPRISETTNIMLLLRRLMNGTEPGAPAGEFAIFFTGDLNANPPKLELSTPRTGTFLFSGFEAMNYWPDDYKLPLVDSAPRLTHTVPPRLFTWKSQTSTSTQRLDYIYYQQSRISKRSSYVVDTENMPFSFREQYGLMLPDSVASDHLLLIADFKKREVDYAWNAQDIEPPGWIYSQWMGWMYQYSEYVHYSPLHGIITSLPDNRGVWFWDQQMGWLFTHAGLYPYTYRQSTTSWIYFNLSFGKPRYYYDFKSGEWISPDL